LAEFMTSRYANTAANVIGRRLFDLTNGWNGQLAAYEQAFVVTHHPLTDWEYADTAPFTFVAPRRPRARHLASGCHARETSAWTSNGRSARQRKRAH
jgi:hypothetical protein